MSARVPYDEIADWYEHEFLVAQRTAGPGSDDGFADRLGIDQALVELLGRGSGACLEIGCGTGIYADRIRRLGWAPLGVDVSAGMLRHARARLPVTVGDATRLPFRTESIDAAIAVMVHTDMPDYPAVLDEIHRVLRPGGVFVSIGVHPCFCGGFADRTSPDAIIIRHGYLDGRWTKESWTTGGVRDKVGAVHFPLPQLLNAFVESGFELAEFSEG
ncbi:MAG: class I SAM-dependent methyltransferase, partial [Ilumatobacteraceae bacterium]